MCSIAGALSSKPDLGNSIEVLKSMNEMMWHRGPNDSGFYSSEHCALAMRRLSIIDVEGGHQPFVDPLTGNVLICNGEIYNHLELKREYQNENFEFQSRSDVEIILHLYRLMGVDFLKKLRGMFALALWDKKRQKLILARDRFGEKPLYYFQPSPGLLYFASEIKALTNSLSETAFELNPQAAASFLSYQYVCEPQTLLKGLHKLSPGTYVEIEPRNFSIEPKPFWSIEDTLDVPAHDTSTLLDTMIESSKLTSRSDVPVGIALSGGIDSSLIAALLRKHTDLDITAFSIGYPGSPENDERRMARDLAEKLKIKFIDRELSSDEFSENFPDLVLKMDSPVADIAAFGYESVAQSARQHDVPVLLNGIGGDELFWGYEWFNNTTRRIQRATDDSWTQNLLLDIPDVRAGQQLAKLLTGQDTFNPRLDARITRRDFAAMDFHNRTWLASNCLTLSDHLNMAHSIESRSPFLDHVLWATVNGMRKNGLDDVEKGQKFLLKQIARDLLGDEILNRPKRGFTPPSYEWMREIMHRYFTLLQNGSLMKRGLLATDYKAHMATSGSVFSWYKLCLLEVWTRLVVDKQSPKELTDMTRARTMANFDGPMVSRQNRALYQIKKIVRQVPLVPTAWRMAKKFKGKVSQLASLVKI